MKMYQVYLDFNDMRNLLTTCKDFNKMREN